MKKEFSPLSNKNNVIELALAIVLAQSFVQTISAVLDYVILPPLGLLLGGKSFPSLFLNLTPNKTLPTGPVDSLEKAHYAGAAVIAYGAFFETLLRLFFVFIFVIAVINWINSSRTHNQIPYAEDSITASQEKPPTETDQPLY